MICKQEETAHIKIPHKDLTFQTGEMCMECDYVVHVGFSLVVLNVINL